MCHIAAGVLAVAGVQKLRSPGSWRALLVALGVPTRRAASIGVPAARVVGLVEIAVAVGVLAVGSPIAAGALAVAYAAVTVVAAMARRRGDVDCGCFGVRSAPVSGLHVAVDLAAAVASVEAATSGASTSVAVLTVGPDAVARGAYVVIVAAGVTLVVGALTAGAELSALRRRVAAR